MTPSPDRKAWVELYFWATPVFALADWIFGANVRVRAAPDGSVPQGPAAIVEMC